MTNPPSSQTKMVRIKAIYPIRLGEGKLEHVVTEGNVVSVSEEDAKEFCDKKYLIGYRDNGGYQTRGAKETQVYRAVRVK
jgi:hypothetical protein